MRVRFQVDSDKDTFAFSFGCFYWPTDGFEPTVFGFGFGFWHRDYLVKFVCGESTALDRQ